MQGSRTNAVLPQRVRCERLGPLAETLARDDKRKPRCGRTALLLSAPSGGPGRRAASHLAPHLWAEQDQRAPYPWPAPISGTSLPKKCRRRERSRPQGWSINGTKALALSASFHETRLPDGGTYTAGGVIPVCASTDGSSRHAQGDRIRAYFCRKRLGDLAVAVAVGVDVADGAHPGPGADSLHIQRQAARLDRELG